MSQPALARSDASPSAHSTVISPESRTCPPRTLSLSARVPTEQGPSEIPVGFSPRAIPAARAGPPPLSPPPTRAGRPRRACAWSARGPRTCLPSAPPPARPRSLRHIAARRPASGTHRCVRRQVRGHRLDAGRRCG
eukprot:23305-Rhodomonas_salina.8